VSRAPKIHVLLAELEVMSKKCGSAAEALEFHTRLKADPSAWAELEPRGYQEYDDTHKLELRNCARCGSTLAIKIPC
jgi:hypothetical protein